MRLNSPKSKNAMRRRVKQEVPRMGVAGELAAAVERAAEESVDGFGDTVPGRVRRVLEMLEADPLDVLGHEHAWRRQVGEHVGDGDERVV